jgi:peptide deformylase
MTTRQIIATPDPILRKKARAVAAITPEIRALMDDMMDTMREAPGVGLAAPQVGVSKRVIVVEYAEPPEAEDQPATAPKQYMLANPEIVRRSRTMANGTEGCLSVPGFSGLVERHTEVAVEGLNAHGDRVRIRARGWLARIFQHEIDHLDGILFTDRASKVNEIRPEEAHDNV